MSHRSVSICDTELRGIRHLCCFYGSEEELSRVFLPYLHQGLTEKEQVTCIFQHAEHEHLREGLRKTGIDITAAEKAGQFQILTEDETYVKGGLFARDRMHDMLKELLERARGTGFPLVRTLGEMSWALRNLPGTDDLMDYECAVNDLCHEYDCTLACAYDVNAFHGRVVADALSTHSHIILNGRVFENPHYVEPREFKKYLAMRRAGAGPLRAHG